MNLPSLLNQRRYRRLALALFAALLVHLGLVLTGNWGILLYSAPSNQDRALTLTLENTTYEGLREASAKEEDTINDAKLGEAKKARSEESTLSKPRPTEAVSEVTDTPITEPVLPMEQQESEALVSESGAVEPATSSTPTEVAPQLITTESESELVVYTPPPPATESKEPLLNEKPVSIQLDAKERKMLEKKVKLWSSKILNKAEAPEPLVWDEKGQQYVASFQKLYAESDMETDEVVIEIATNRNGQQVSTNLRLKKMAFSNFAQFVHRWDERVSIHDDEMNGRFHSNTKFNVVANRRVAPLFHGKVTTASYFVYIEGSVSRKKIFLAGLETGVKRIAMPKPSVLFNSVPQEENLQSKVIEQNSRLIFNSDGSYLVQAHQDVGVMRRYEIGDRPMYILAAPGVSLSLSGTVNGAVAVYSPKRITIEGNLEYLSTDHIDQGGDFLGLISGRSVVVAKRNKVPSGDLNVQAAIYAKNRFEVRQILGRQEGTLNILGSVSAGSITATEPRYATNIIFDTRLENLRPPGFPVTDRYEVLAQQNNWQLEDEPFYEVLEEEDISNADIVVEPLLEHY